MKSGPMLLPDEYILQKCVVQEMCPLKRSSKMYRLKYETEKTMRLAEFKKEAESFEQPELTQSERENLIWSGMRKCCSNKTANAEMNPTYAIDNEQSLFTNKFPYWNLNEITKNDSLIHGGEIIPGVNTPFLNFGMFGTCFGLHHEDSNLGSINKLHGGASKTWVSIPSSEAPKLEKFVHDAVPKSISTRCNRYIRHKAVMIPPSELEKHGIQFAKVSFLFFVFAKNF